MSHSSSEGTIEKFFSASAVPAGLAVLIPGPGDESPGYFRMFLRDTMQRRKGMKAQMTGARRGGIFVEAVINIFKLRQERNMPPLTALGIFEMGILQICRS